jgi:hypothetical protein
MISQKQAQYTLWTAGILNWKMHAAQKVIDAGIAELPQSVKEAVILCSRRFGKSYYGVLHALEQALQKPGSVIRIIGPDIKQTKMIVEYNMAKITQELSSCGLSSLVQYIKTENRYIVGRSNIYLGGFDSQADSLRGGEANLILVEESGSSNPDQYTYQMVSVLKPQLLKTRGRMIHLTTLPPVPDHPFINETIPQAKLNDAFYSYTIYDDPLATEEIIADAIKDCGGAHTEAFRREYLNEIIRDRNIVIVPDYDERVHVKAITRPTSVNYEIYTDWGGVRDFTVSLLMGYDFLRAVDLVFDEMWWPANTPTEVINRDIKAKWSEIPVKKHYVDCPGQLLIDLNQTHKMDVQIPDKGDLEANINTAANRFTIRKVEIDQRCKLLRQTCQSGTFNKQRTDFARTLALGHMDAFAALMYGIKNLDRTSPYAPDTKEHDFMYIPPSQLNPPSANVVPRKSFLKDQTTLKVFK